MSYPLASGNTTMSGIYIPEIWSGKAIEKFYLATVFGAIANTDYEGEISAKGDKVIIRNIPDMIVRDYVIGQGLQYTKQVGAIVELLIDKGKYFAFPVNNVEKKQADINFMDKWSDDAGQQMKIAIDSDVLAGVYASAHAKNKGAAAGNIVGNINLGAAGTPIEITKANVVDKIVELGQVLQEQNVPETGRWVVIPAWMATRIKTSDLKDASVTGDGTSTLRNGRIGRIDKFEIFESNNLPFAYDSAAGKNGFHVMAGHKSAITFASQMVENEMLTDPNDFGKLIRGLQVYGYKVIKPESLVDFYCAPADL